MSYNPKVSAYIQKADESQIYLLSQIRALIHDSIEGVSEEIKWGFPVFSKTKDFTYFRHSKKHITVGFYNIDRIKDPKGILEGSGNTLKHIKIKSEDDIDESMLDDWFKSIAF